MESDGVKIPELVIKFNNSSNEIDNCRKMKKKRAKKLTL